MNTFQTLAFECSFKDCSNPVELNAAFKGFLQRLTSEVEENLNAVTKISEVAEVFHHATLAGAFVQAKARLRRVDIVSENSNTIESLALTQLGVTPKEDKDSSLSRIHDLAYSLAGGMSQEFYYSGRCMRALAITVLSNYTSCQSNDLFMPSGVLRNYPIANLVCEDHDDTFCLIGRIKDTRFRSSHSSPRNVSDFTPTKDRLTKVLSNKIEELFQENDNKDWGEVARLEEMRDYLSDSLCRFFFNVNIINLPRVFSLVDSVLNTVNENGIILEQDLNTVAPPECMALLNHETIIRKDTIDLDSVWYRINEGVKVFVSLSERLNLFSGKKRVMMARIAEKL